MFLSFSNQLKHRLHSTYPLKCGVRNKSHDCSLDPLSSDSARTAAQNAVQTGNPIPHQHNGGGIVELRGSDFPPDPDPALQLPPRAEAPPEAPNPNPALPDDRLRARPPNLLHGRLRHRLRRHRRAPRHRLHAGPRHRLRSTRRVPPGTRQRAVHRRGPLLRLHVRARRRRHRSHGPRARSQPRQVRQGLLRHRGDLLSDHCLRHEYALH